MNRRTATFLRKQVKAGAVNTLTQDQVAGRGRVTHFDGIPIRRVDQLLKTEAAIV